MKIDGPSVQAVLNNHTFVYVQDALKSNLEASVIPAFEMSCKAMFDQVDSTFQKGMVEHATTVQQQFESTHSPLSLALRVSFLSFRGSCISFQESKYNNHNIFVTIDNTSSVFSSP